MARRSVVRAIQLDRFTAPAQGPKQRIGVDLRMIEQPRRRDSALLEIVEISRRDSRTDQHIVPGVGCQQRLYRELANLT
jgi:hypothetical protein